MKIEKIRTYGWESALMGMRNPKDSWDKSDSAFGIADVEYTDIDYDIAYLWAQEELGKTISYDDEEVDYEKLDENTYRISGSTTIHDLRKILNIPIPEGEYDTLSGYLIEQLGRIPLDDEKPEIETEYATYKIEDYEDKRILWVKVCKNNIEEHQENENLEDEEDEEEE